MLFNSFEFAIYLPVIFILYWFVSQRNLKAQNLLLLVASYVFYGWWDWRFLSLLAFSSLVDYFVGVGFTRIDDSHRRKLLLLASICVNLGFLGFFKYYNFFAESFADVFTLLGKPIEVSRLNIILPVGISFYTFQTLSYSIDCYKRKLEPTKDFVAFFAFVSFFPQLVAGPIERASNLLPQFYKKRIFNAELAQDGFRQIIWGLFKKVVIADTCAQYVNDIFDNYPEYSGATVALGIIYFSFQIYGDFSGYSDIAIGTARLFGFDLMRNFAYPYFSRDIAEFWRRWHISLSTWFRDYLYIPLGGSRGGLWHKIRNTFIIFIVSGFWHGANWTFIVWGALNALYYMPIMLLKRNRKNLEIVGENRWYPSLREVVNLLITFTMAAFAWIFFRAQNLTEAFSYINKMITGGIGIDKLEIQRYSFEILPLIGILLLFEWFARKRMHPLNPGRWMWPKIAMVIMLIMALGSYSSLQDFIYFQF